jgi:hypothetical protein
VNQSAAGGPVGDQPSDGHMGLGVVLAAPHPALQRPPLLGLGDGMLHTDPPRGLLLACLLVDGDLFGRRVLGRFGWWGVDLIGKRLGQALVAGVDGDGDGWVLARQVFDPLGLDRGLVVHAAWARRPGPSVRPWPSEMVVVLMVFCCLLPETNARPPSTVRPGPPDLGLGPIQAKVDAFGGGVGEHIRQGVQPHTWHGGDGDATLGQQRPDLVDRAGNGGAVHPIQHRQGLGGSCGRRITRVTSTRS